MTQLWVRCGRCGRQLRTLEVKIEEGSVPSVSIIIEPHQCEVKLNE